jgi:hypothetical protein
MDMKKSIVVLTLLPAAAFAQQQGTPTEQAMSAKLLQEIQSGLTCSVNLITVQADLAKANARIKELEPKTDRPPEK